MRSSPRVWSCRTLALRPPFAWSVTSVHWGTLPRLQRTAARFSQRSRLLQHQSAHREKPYFPARTAAASDGAALIHRSTHYQARREKLHAGDDCGRRHSPPSLLASHRRCPLGAAALRLHLCSKRFAQWSHLLSISSCTRGEAPFPCLESAWPAASA